MIAHGGVILSYHPLISRPSSEILWRTFRLARGISALNEIATLRQNFREQLFDRVVAENVSSYGREVSDLILYLSLVLLSLGTGVWHFRIGRGVNFAL